MNRHQANLKRSQLVNAFIEHINAAAEIEKNLDEGGCIPFIEIFNIENSALWISLTAPERTRIKYALYRDKIDEEPCLSVAALLVPELNNLIPEVLQMQGCTIQIEGNKGRVCISGSFSVDKVKEYLESGQ